MTQIQQLKQQHSLASWKQIILAQQNSGLTAAEYCRQQNIKYNAFYYWQRKIREDFAAATLQITQKDEPAPEFATLATAMNIPGLLSPPVRKESMKKSL